MKRTLNLVTVIARAGSMGFVVEFTPEIGTYEAMPTLVSVECLVKCLILTKSAISPFFQSGSTSVMPALLPLKYLVKCQFTSFLIEWHWADAHVNLIRIPRVMAFHEVLNCHARG